MLPKKEKTQSEFKTKQFWLSIVAEYIGTGLLVYIATSVCNVSCEEKPRNNNTASSNLECSLAYGLGVATLAHWTEGLFNPALTVAFTSTGKLSLVKGVLMIIMEILGGISGAALTYALTPSSIQYSLGDTVLRGNTSTIQGLFVEIILTFMLTLTVYAAKDPGRKCDGYDTSLAYGFAVTLCCIVGYKYTSCGINPARSFGPAVVREISGLGKSRSEWQHHWIYWIGPIGGSLFAGVFYHFLYSLASYEYDTHKGNYTSRSYRERECETNL